MNEGKVCVNFMESLSDSECRLTFQSLRRVQFPERGIKMMLEKKMNWLIQPVQIYRSV